MAAAQTLYVLRGIAEVAVADLAYYLRLPADRILHHFPQQAALVEAVVDAHAQTIYQQLRQHRANSSTAVEELLALRNWSSTERKPSLVPFFQQLATNYPAGQRRWQAHLAAFPAEHLRQNLHWGMHQHLYYPTLDVEARVHRWFRTTSILRTAAAIDRADMHRTLLENFLTAIMTPAGAFVARRLQEAAPFY